MVEEASRQEVADFIRSKLKGKDAELLLDQLELGDVSPEQAREYAKVMLDHRDDTRTRPRRKSD